MIPIDTEFSMLYVVYAAALILILVGFVSAPSKNEFRYHLLFYALYTGFMIYTFSDKENFAGGGSLVVLFYGLLFPILHFVIFRNCQIPKICQEKGAKYLMTHVFLGNRQVKNLTHSLD